MESVGGYELTELLGRGTAGTVWRAIRPGPVAQVVAVKRARITAGTVAASRLRDEAAVLAELDHPHIMRVLDVIDDGDDVAIVMPLARGGSLRDLLAERGSLTPGQVVAVLAPVAAALGSAHRRGVFHGDVKPANILFTSDGEPLLSDFGVARSLVAAADPSQEVAGTAAYLDPELLTTGRPDARNDVYAVGVVAYLALTGRLPHTGASADDILAAADAGDHHSLLDDRSVPSALAEVVESALARLPEERPPTAEALAGQLRAALPPTVVGLPGTALAPVGDDRSAHPLPDDGAAGAYVGGGAPGSGGSGGSGGDDGHRTRLFGPRPPRPEPADERSDHRLAAVSVLAVVALLLVAAVVARDRYGSKEPAASATVAVTRDRSRPCPSLPPIPVPAGARELRADLKGDGCPVQVVWDGQVMQLRLSSGDALPRRYDFKRQLRRQRHGDLLMGDWDCDGAESPALYDPGTGVVYYFGTVPERGALPADREDRTGNQDGRARVVQGRGDRCDEVAVGRTA